jgi:hypothetical protein
MLASLDFFDFFVFRETGTFLMEDLVTRGTAAGSSVSGTEALSGTAVFREGAAGASSGVSSSSLKMRNGFFTAWKRKEAENKKQHIVELEEALTNP